MRWPLKLPAPMTTGPRGDCSAPGVPTDDTTANSLKLLRGATATALGMRTRMPSSDS